MPGLRPLRILLVEDDMLNQTYIAAMLINHGHTVVTAADGVQALDILSRDTFELILLDVQLPVKSGIEVLHELRSWEKKRSCRYPTKVIGVTAYAMKGDHERFLAAGMDDCVHKPFEFEELLACMAKVLGQ